jgi:hypothetical protein
LRYQEDPSVILATNKKSYEKNKESWSVAKNTYNRGRYTENIEEERKRRSDWKKNNRHLVCAQSAHRRAKQNSATPPWLTKEHCEQIKLIYSHARECEMLTGELDKFLYPCIKYPIVLSIVATLPISFAQMFETNCL